MADLAEAVLDRSGYLAELQASTDLQDASRIENLNELVAVAREYDAQHPDGTLADFLEQVSLVADADQIPEGEDHGGMVTLMTLHTAKGLEFPVVFLTGLEENVFPHQRSMRRRQGTRGGTPAGLRGHHPGRAAAVPHPGGGPGLVGPAGVPPAVPVPGRDPRRTSSSGGATQRPAAAPAAERLAQRAGGARTPGNRRVPVAQPRATRSPTTPTAWARSCPWRAAATTPRPRSTSAATTGSSTWCCATRPIEKL